MKVLLCILSWVEGCREDKHKAQRATFLQDVSKFPGLDYKIFVGNNEPTGEGWDYDSNKSFEAANHLTREHNAIHQPKMPFDYVPREDEVVLRIPDDLAHVAFKARAAWQWALDNGYDYVFNCFCDTYVDIEKLMHSEFEKHDFIGLTYDSNRCPLGGVGYWLSKRCLQILVQSHVDFWADDGWAGWTLQKHDIWLHCDPTRYVQYPELGVPAKHNDVVSVHVGQIRYYRMRNIYDGTWYALSEEERRKDVGITTEKWEREHLEYRRTMEKQCRA